METFAHDPKPNQVVCPECGRIRLETPPGTTALPTIGMALKASGAAGKCDCGRAPDQRPGALLERGVTDPPSEGQEG